MFVAARHKHTVNCAYKWFPDNVRNYILLACCLQNVPYKHKMVKYMDNI